MSNKKLILVSQSLRKGGAERVVSNLSNTFSELGFDVHIVLFQNEITYKFSGSLFCLDSYYSKSYIRKLWELVVRVYKLRKLFKVIGATRVLCFTESANFPSILTGVDVVVSVRNNPDKKLNWWQKLLVRYLYNRKNVTSVVAVSKAIQHTLKYSYGVERCVAIPNGIDRLHLESMSKKTYKVDGDKARWFVKREYLLAVGRLEFQKGYDRLLTAYSQSKIRNKMPLVILGEGSLRSELEMQAQILNISDRVFFVGAIDNPYYFMVNSYAYLLTSRFEGFPNALLEALSLGCLCLSTNCISGPSELLQDKENGLLVEDSTNGILEGLEQLASLDSIDITSMKNLGKESASKYDLKEVCKEWLKI